MKFELNTEKLAGAFSESDIALVRRQFWQAATLTNRLMAIDNVKVNFISGEWVNRFWGVQGYAPDAHTTNIYLHPAHHLRTNLNDGRIRFAQTVSHELHHNKRWRDPGYGEHLGEMIVSEGLAIKFQHELGYPKFNGDCDLHDGMSLAQAEHFTLPLLDRVVPKKFEDFDDQLNNVFSQRYALGIHIVNAWSERTGQTAAAAHNIPAEEILRPWRNKELKIGPALG